MGIYVEVNKKLFRAPSIKKALDMLIVNKMRRITKHLARTGTFQSCLV